MESESAQTDGTNETGNQTIVIDHLFGFHRGSRQLVAGDRITIGSSSNATIHFPAAHEPAVAPHHAAIVRHDGVCELIVADGEHAQVNGIETTRHLLSSGDVIVVGAHGPVLRFRVYDGIRNKYKTIPEAIADCRDSARHQKNSVVGRAIAFIRAMPHEMLRQTAPWTRKMSFALTTLLVFSTIYLVVRSFQLAGELDEQAEQVLSLIQANDESMTNDELRVLQSELESKLSTTLERVEALEALTAAGRKVVASSAESVMLLQGEYGFVGPEGRELRFVITPGGQPLMDRKGYPVVRPDGTGEPYRSQFTGTGFLVSSGGLVITNRHVAAPWEFEPSAVAVLSMGYQPVMNRMIGYFPNVSKAFDIKLVLGSSTEDLALLRCEGDPKDIPPLQLADASVSPGDEVIVLGYPTGIRALLARTDLHFVNQLLEESKRDFWYIARRLSEEGRIAPLATRGIVGQVTPTAVVYDAETTHGGSGGPVMSLSGEVVAINTAILTDFGGSNLGVPVDAARRLLDLATRPE